jgi:N6-L-threonylcarbamoyladenine synthase
LIVLGIETSCDETAVAILENKNILANVLYSQVREHSKFGGVVPEIASRKHIEKITLVFEEAMEESQVDLKNVDMVAVTTGPGLVGSLLVGVNFAKGIAYALKKPLLPVNHIEGHILAVLLENNIEFPFLSLVASGGHTSLFLVKNVGEYVLLGKTLDDAAGEAFDKVSKMLGLGYPGGPVIEKMAEKGEFSIKFPKSFMEKDNLNFSFSGLKTSVMNYIRKHSWELPVYDICRSFQETVAETFLFKIGEAVRKEKIRTVTFSGGVACNKFINQKIKEFSLENNLKFYSPSPRFCSDNAAMIALTAFLRGQRKPTEYPFDFSLNAMPRMKLC